jgi:hypothetical protein
MAVAAIPAGFDRVKQIDRTDTGVTLTSESGKAAKTLLDFTFLTPRA